MLTLAAVASSLRFLCEYAECRGHGNAATHVGDMRREFTFISSKSPSHDPHRHTCLYMSMMILLPSLFTDTVE